PFTINYKDIAINIDGSHTFDSKMNYKATLEVPAKYLGKDINALIARIDDTALNNLTIPVIANISGQYTNPQVTTDLTSGVKNLTSQLIEIEKQKLVNKGKDKAKDLIGGILSGNKTEKDSTKQESTIKTGAKEVLGDLISGSKKKDSLKTKQDTLPVKSGEAAVKEKAKDILGGLLGKKKKPENPVKKDSIN
ncbi:MAG: AsmA-like C-terminal region-containing protein, partial [Maribacter sp.]